MKTSTWKFSGVAIALSAALFQPAAFAQPSAAPHAHGAGGQQPGSSSMGGMDMKAMMKDMNEKMSSMQMSGDADVDFAMMMRIHHQGAIDMARAELQDGKNPQMRKMANEIIAAQKKEIAQIDRFLAKHQGGAPMKVGGAERLPTSVQAARSSLTFSS